MLFVCHPKFCIWYVMVFLEWLIVPQVEQPPAAVTCSITAGEFKSFTRTTLGQFRYFLVLLCSFFVFFFSILSARALEIPVFYLVSVHAFMLGFVSFFFQLRLLCNYGLFSDLLFARLTGCIDFGMLRYFHVSFAHCSLIFPLALRFSFLGYQFVLFILESCLIAMLRSGFYTIFWLPLGPVIVLLIKL